MRTRSNAHSVVAVAAARRRAAAGAAAAASSVAAPPARAAGRRVVGRRAARAAAGRIRPRPRRPSPRRAAASSSSPSAARVARDGVVVRERVRRELREEVVQRLRVLGRVRDLDNEQARQPARRAVPVDRAAHAAPHRAQLAAAALHGERGGARGGRGAAAERGEARRERGRHVLRDDLDHVARMRQAHHRRVERHVVARRRVPRAAEADAALAPALEERRERRRVERLRLHEPRVALVARTPEARVQRRPVGAEVGDRRVALRRHRRLEEVDAPAVERGEQHAVRARRAAGVVRAVEADREARGSRAATRRRRTRPASRACA